MRPSFSSAGTFTPDTLIAGDFPVVSEMRVITGGAALARGAVLGEVTADRKLKLSAAAAADGSEAPKYILLDDADASGGDVAAPVARTGEFNQRRVVLGAGHTLDSVREDLAALGIHLRNALEG